ncbi:hypothetical protein DKG75_03630 [Zavarzinia compransoris]|uniref:LysM domain-containing protein n=1 Tax=Zavarzinia compransoris TaxID=1264899 RepID=A0A317EC31_9PROT|nr:hypothetical protein DKG75_03630 [Zavarzinia compransoris]
MATRGFLPGMIRLAAPLIAALALSACGGREDLAPVEYLTGGQGGGVTAVHDSGAMPPVEAAPVAPVDRGGIAARPLDEPAAVTGAPAAIAAPPAAATAVAAPGETTVGAGETLSAVSRRTGVPIRDLIELNGLSAPFTVQPGQRLRLPQAQFHVVAPGDTVYNISRRYGVDQASLMAENGIQPPYTIKLGQRLRIPGRVQAPAEAAAPAPTPVAPPAAAVPAAPIEIIEPDPDSLPPPADGSMYVPPPAAPETAAVGTANVPRPARKPAPPAVAAAPAAPARPAPATAAAPAAPAPSAATPRFAWPVAGDVISGFGPKSGGQHNDGINIQAAQGTTVRASDGGTVAYAGDEIRGFGNLILIRHNGTYMTAYAHNATLLVKQGDKVARGQPIARVGNSGNVTVPQLHFEVRKNGTPVDPMKYLDGGAG